MHFFRQCLYFDSNFIDLFLWVYWHQWWLQSGDTKRDHIQHSMIGLLMIKMQEINFIHDYECFPYYTRLYLDSTAITVRVSTLQRWLTRRRLLQCGSSLSKTTGRVFLSSWLWRSLIDKYIKTDFRLITVLFGKTVSYTHRRIGSINLRFSHKIAGAQQREVPPNFKCYVIFYFGSFGLAAVYHLSRYLHPIDWYKATTRRGL